MLNGTVKERLLLTLAAIMAVAVTPFAYLRVREEHWTMAAVNICIVVFMLLIFAYVYTSRNTRAPGIFMALVFIGASLLSMHLLGASQIYWIYPAMTAAFFMLDTRYAVSLALLAFCSVLVMLWDVQSAMQLLTICVTLIATALFAYAFAVTARRQQSQLEHLATVDPLTGAGNRRAHDAKLDVVNAIFRRKQSPASLLILDVDLFKDVNDRHGHVIGDQILIEIVDLIRSNIRPTETLYRYGGEEFVVVAEQTGLREARHLGDKLRQLIEEHSFVADIAITVSIGIAELGPGEGRQGWLGRADSALFKAKNSGRNRVFEADVPGPNLTAVPARSTCTETP